MGAISDIEEKLLTCGSLEW